MFPPPRLPSSPVLGGFPPRIVCLGDGRVPSKPLSPSSALGWSTSIAVTADIFRVSREIDWMPTVTNASVRAIVARSSAGMVHQDHYNGPASA